MNQPTILQELIGVTSQETRQAWIEVLQRRNDGPIHEALQTTAGRSFIKRLAKYMGESTAQEFIDSLIEKTIEEL